MPFSRFSKHVLFLACLIIASCHSQKKQSATEVGTNSSDVSGGRRMDNFVYLQRCMNGNFSSIEQSKNDSDYFDIRLRMVPIWKSTPEVFYLYVEQSMSTMLDKPYRQRVYKVIKEDATHFTSYIYLMNQPERFTGKKEGDAIFNVITPDSIKIKDGCEVHLSYNASTSNFTGSTGEKTCASDRSGASWATSKVTIGDEQMVSWDQGWDASGKQVWGAEKGGYIFRKDQ